MSSQIWRQINRVFLAATLLAVLSGCSAAESPVASPTPTQTPTQTPSSTPTASETPIFVALGDYGSGDSNQRAVAESIAQNNPKWFVALGDNVYSQDGYEILIGDYYGDFVSNSKFLPATGNHDYKEGIANYDAYFGTDVPTRFYKYSIASDIDLFVLDSQASLDSKESMKLQKDWLIEQVSNSKAKYKFVVLHHPPFSSGVQHGSNPKFQWEFEKMGVTAVLSGHEHLYERLSQGSVTYLVSGAGGQELYDCGQPISSEDICIDGKFGALYFTRNGNSLIGEFRSSTGKILDSFTL